MRPILDELLMAYADGELGDGDRRDVEASLSQSSDARQRLEVFTSTRKTLSNLFNQPMGEPVPQHLIDAVMAMPIGTAGKLADRSAQSDVSNVIPFNNGYRRATFGGLPSWALAAACISMLVVGAGWMMSAKQGLGSNVSDVAILDNGALIAGSALSHALETVHSGDAVALTENGATRSLKPILTFATASKLYCRQYEVTGQGQGGLSGVACREPSGRWRIEVQAPIAMQSSATDKIAPAAGRDGNTPVDAAVDRLMSGDAMGFDDESAAIQNGWR